MASQSRLQLESWLKTIHAKGNVLDVGGSQNPLKGRTKAWDVAEYKIMDLEQPHETKRNPDIICDIQGPIEFNDTFTENIGKYNQIFCIEVSEYWYDPLTALRNLNLLLKKGGELYITFHFFYPVHNPENEDCLRYTRAGIKKLFEKSGFAIEKITPRYYSNSVLVNMLIANEGMRGVGGSINTEQAYCVKAVK